MVQINFLITALAALVPLITGSIWYNPKIGFGNAWMKSTGLSEEELRKSNMAVIFTLVIVFAFMIALTLNTMVRHEFGLMSMMANHAKDADALQMYNDVTGKYGAEFHTFKHGAFHGFLIGLFVALPILGTNALFERKGFKYIAIHTGYWMLTLALMGGIICGFS
ncbi:hypothetical protein CAP35_09140 [Chitinophagaceae bacterium IBVUCB1]|nr:hypothetical protein CAP35_09140 [Chitinophagaceae bacterium IBVUCB1]